MSQRYQACEREQQYLIPASLRDWLPEDHLVWFVLEAVELLDLSSVHAAYCEGERSSRRSERRCRADVAYRVLSANQQPDHATAAASASVMSRPWPDCSSTSCGSAPRRAWSGPG